MFTTSITLALYVSAALVALLLVVGGACMAARAADAHGRYAKRKAWQDVRKYVLCVVCTAPVVTVLVVFAACAGQVLAGGAA